MSELIIYFSDSKQRQDGIPKAYKFSGNVPKCNFVTGSPLLKFFQLDGAPNSGPKKFINSAKSNSKIDVFYADNIGLFSASS